AGFVFRSICLGSWPFLASLTLGWQEDIVMLPLDAQQSQSQRCLEKLKDLTLRGPTSLVRSSGLSISELMVWKCFPFLEELTICNCDSLVRWPTEELRCMDRLRVLRIRDCQNLEGNTSSSEEATLPLSLEEMDISDCRSVAKLPPSLGNLAKLRRLEVSRLLCLKQLPDGMCGLASLRKLLICECPDLEELPHGLLERLPALEFIHIDVCPALQRRCREGGEYFHLLSAVPHKTFGYLDEESRKSKLQVGISESHHSTKEAMVDPPPSCRCARHDLRSSCRPPRQGADGASFAARPAASGNRRPTRQMVRGRDLAALMEQRMCAVGRGGPMD
uniref:Disease resistance protein At4g27190-like leucine-rich repeats domain-containing protein n=1 Tax=Aegilops tauschii subsp. strangulata TaxID=200361 RepID=A0A453QCL2_AEGTS